MPRPTRLARPSTRSMTPGTASSSIGSTLSTMPSSRRARDASSTALPMSARSCPRGGKVFTMLDTSYVYMDVYLPNRGGRPDQARLRRSHRSRCLSRACDPGQGGVHRLASAVHAQDCGNQGRARQADVPDPGTDRSRALARPRRDRQKRSAGRRLSAHRSGGRMASPIARRRALMSGRDGTVARLDQVTQRYRDAVALDAVTLPLPAGRLVGLIGPDGVGKSSLLSIVAGARRIQSGKVYVFDGDMADGTYRAAVCPRIAYMPQGLGKNLYPDLSVHENIEFFGRLFGQSASERRSRIVELLDSTGLAPFSGRPAKKLSGGMRQKLGLCCSLIHDPDLLILDEPTTGVDPLSRRQFWELIDRIRARRSGMSVIVATAYMEEAERFDWLAAMNAGKVLATGSPAELRSRVGAKDLESAFIALLPEEKRKGHKAIEIPPRKREAGPPAIEADGLTKRFDKFVAVDHVSFRIGKGEIFGFLGSNGCGKSTTMKMLTGLLPATEGKAMLFGQPVGGEDMETRRRVGYISQSFSLYAELTVRQNLDLHAHLFHLPRRKARARIA